MTRRFMCSGYEFSDGKEFAEVVNGRITLNMPPQSGCIYSFSFADD